MQLRLSYHGLLTFFTLVSFLEPADSKKIVQCEKFGENSKFLPTTCSIKPTSVIDAEDFQISSNLNASAITFNQNWNFSYLPIKVGELFPDLHIIEGTSCLFKKISEANFEGLKSLKELRLSSNHIEEIPSECFKDLISLKELQLSE